MNIDIVKFILKKYHDTCGLYHATNDNTKGKKVDIQNQPRYDTFSRPYF